MAKLSKSAAKAGLFSHKELDVENAATALRHLQASQLDLRNVLFDAGARLGNVHLGELFKASLASQLAKLRPS
jgi:hypothetical protein